ncbi:DUF7556 family protein [Haloferacaceae archaeon DSL9]
MTPDLTPGADVSDAEIVSSVDSSSSHPAFIIADISRDDAWLAVREMEAPILAEWC